LQVFQARVQPKNLIKGRRLIDLLINWHLKTQLILFYRQNNLRFDALSKSLYDSGKNKILSIVSKTEWKCHLGKQFEGSLLVPAVKERNMTSTSPSPHRLAFYDRNVQMFIIS
jgi:hypothetical protein